MSCKRHFVTAVKQPQEKTYALFLWNEARVFQGVVTVHKKYQKMSFFGSKIKGHSYLDTMATPH